MIIASGQWAAQIVNKYLRATCLFQQLKAIVASTKGLLHRILSKEAVNDMNHSFRTRHLTYDQCKAELCLLVERCYDEKQPHQPCKLSYAKFLPSNWIKSRIGIQYT